MIMLKIKPNDLAVIKETLLGSSETMPFEVRFKYAKIARVCDDSIELMRSTIKRPDVAEYEDAIRAVKESMSNEQDVLSKIDLISEVNKRYKDTLDLIKKYNEELSDAANKPIEVDIPTLSEDEVPKDAPVRTLSILLPILNIK